MRTDLEAGAYVAVRHLIDLGHRRIAVLVVPKGVSTSATGSPDTGAPLPTKASSPKSELVVFGG